jgi:hypothetical protein
MPLGCNISDSPNNAQSSQGRIAIALSTSSRKLAERWQRLRHRDVRFLHHSLPFSVQLEDARDALYVFATEPAGNPQSENTRRSVLLFIVHFSPRTLLLHQMRMC